MATPASLIAKKRDGLTHAPGEIAEIIQGLMKGDFADYQMSAWLMAAFLKGLDEAETLALTDAMLKSGIVLDFSGLAGKKIDKHSTGGVGDKVSLALAPLVAACGVKVPMVSGRGLGHTGGTLDKLEAIPGFSVNLSLDRFRAIIEQVGTCMIGQTAEIAPADKRIYALRDVTATVENVSLITASILSKKLAEGIDGLVLDVKVGRGAFMKDLESARTLARSLVSVARRGGKSVTAFLTDMDHPLGLTIGNALETMEAIETLKDAGPNDLRELTLTLAAEMIVLGEAAKTTQEARVVAEKALASGKALETFAKMIELQGGDAMVIEQPQRMGVAPVIHVLTAHQSGYVTDVDPMVLALAALRLGAGRLRAEAAVDPRVGVVLLATKGDYVEVGSPLLEVHAPSESAAGAELLSTAAAFRIGTARASRGPLIRETIR